MVTGFACQMPEYSIKGVLQARRHLSPYVPGKR